MSYSPVAYSTACRFTGNEAFMPITIRSAIFLKVPFRRDDITVNPLETPRTYWLNARATVKYENLKQ